MTVAATEAPGRKRAVAIHNPTRKVPEYYEWVQRFRIPRGRVRARNQVLRDYDAAIIFGGDGTIHLHLRALVAYQRPLLVVPIGSGNDFAVSLGIRTPQDALNAWSRFVRVGDNVREIDLGVIHPVGCPPQPLSPSAKLDELYSNQDFRYYCCVAGLGFDSDANLRANAMPNWLKRHGGYTVAALQTIFSYVPKRVRLTANCQTLDDTVTLVAIGNAPTYGDGLAITPRAVLDDGKLDVCYVRALAKSQLFRFFPTVFKGNHLKIQQVDYLQSDHIAVHTDVPMRIHADGEHAGHTPAEFRVIPKALKVIVP